MKRTISKLALLFATVGFVMTISHTAFGAARCGNMEITKVGTKVIGTVQFNSIRVKRTSDATCGTMGTNTLRSFNFAEANGDAGLATALTALSLGRKVLLDLTSDDAEAGTTIENIQIEEQ